ncbi:P-loop containing nucleoside triphosphate hydrolase protein [Lentinula edodes]|nr:P-loop containing nucleoside triphosphate hydrolase protein [Lentinula edodes]
MKSRVATLLSKTRSSKGSVKQATIDELRTEKEELEVKVDKLQDECNIYQKNAEDARTACRQAEEVAQKAKEMQLRAEEEKQTAIEKMEEAQRIAAEHEEETKKQISAAEVSASAAREAAEREKQALEAQGAAERAAEEERAKFEKADQTRILTEQELGARLSEVVDTKDAAEAARDAALEEAERAPEDARSMKEDFERALEKSRDAQYDAQKQAEDHRKAKEKAEVEKRNAERYSQKQEAQAKKDREAAISAIAAKDEAERNARKALEAFDEAQRKWKDGVQPATSPSESQVDALRRSRQFREGAFHVGVAGLTGTGKSSLINALMGVITGTAEAVPTGTQSTKSVGRYIDARRNYPHIWYDVPGAGTLTAPSWNYFHDQGLFVFDAIMVVWDNRFTDVDIAVLENCVRLKIPAFIIRTKSDVHITNIEERMRDVVEADPTLTNKDRKSRFTVIPFSARAEYISETRQGVELSLHNANLPSMKVYLVSNKTITKIVQGDKNMRNVRVIDEFDLLNDIWALRRATSRGGGSTIPRMHNVRANTTPVM